MINAWWLLLIPIAFVLGFALCAKMPDTGYIKGGE